jgi:hypothetical protein
MMELELARQQANCKHPVPKEIGVKHREIACDDE